MFTATVHEIKAAHRVFLLGYGELYSEDMSHGQDVEGVMIVNPFR